MFAPSRTALGALALVLAWISPAAVAAETPAPFTAQLLLVRYDAPRGLSDGFAPTRQLARRVDGENAVDWPELTLNGRAVFASGAEEKIECVVNEASTARTWFQIGGDQVIQPGNHWFRAVQSPPGRRHIYTADKTARGAAATTEFSGRYELWTFPIRISGLGAPTVKNVVLKCGGAVVFQKPGPWRSLTLLLPANEPGRPYELTVNGLDPAEFNVGLQPVKLGQPRELIFPVEITLGSGRGRLLVENVMRADTFPNQREWDADVAASSNPPPAAPALNRSAAPFARYLGIEVPRSPLLQYAAALPHGRSGGFYQQGGRSFVGSVDEYADFLAAQGIDVVFERASALPATEDPESFERRAQAFAKRGISFGLQYDQNSTRPSLQNPNLPILAHTLPDWHAPLYRSLQLAAQRFATWPNFVGVQIGAGDAGYAPAGFNAPPSAVHLWGEAMIEFTGNSQPSLPRPLALGRREFSFEESVRTVGDAEKFLQRYDAAYRQYGYFAEAVREVDPRLIFTTANFGSAPAAGARGGWPWASLPGRAMFEGLDVQQAYDANQTYAAKPLHNVALIDRLNSYAPDRRTWALLDNHQLLYGREAFQRACALVLTRGVQGIGTNFLPPTRGDAARPDVAAFQKEMAEWMRKFGGGYAATEPLATIGIFYSHQHALRRRVVGGSSPNESDLLRGSHEGRVTEALFLCHAAGWPARVITYQEVARGPLPESMKAILLVGLDAADGAAPWGAGLEPRLQEFLARGGRILADAESECAVPFRRTELKVAAYVAQSNLDATPLLLARNAENIVELRRAMDGVAEPVAFSTNERLWAVPTRCGNTQFVTAVNQDFAEGAEADERLRPADPLATKPERWKMKANASLFVKPQNGTLKWNSSRPIYDVRLGRKISADEAAQVDLTADGFRWYALPEAEVTTPDVTFAVDANGFYEALPRMVNGAELTGIPVQISLRAGEDAATVFGATGQRVRLPISRHADRGAFSITVTELLSGLKTEKTLEVNPVAAPAAAVIPEKALVPFAKRKHVTLTIALTPTQAADSAVLAQAKLLAAWFEKKGRRVSIGSAAPGGVVESLQVLKSPHRFPHWKTSATDLVLFGTPADNVLLLDQARAGILRADLSTGPAIHYTRSPFVGEYDAVNVIARDAAGIAEAVRTLTK